MRKPIITLDGPAGTGKSTVAKRVAKRLGLRFLDTGAMYRAVAWKVKQRGFFEIQEIAVMIAGTRIEVGEERVTVDGVDVTKMIRTPEITKAVGPIAADPRCREALVRMQREIGRGGDLVTEGRDQGSVVFPDAEYKFYIDASIEERARRRHRELGGDLETVRREIEARDRADMTRKAGPLVKPKGAVVIDTTSLTIDQVVEAICSRVGTTDEHR